MNRLRSQKKKLDRQLAKERKIFKLYRSLEQRQNEIASLQGKSSSIHTYISTTLPFTPTGESKSYDLLTDGD
jgi:hypothetical protein